MRRLLGPDRFPSLLRLRAHLGRSLSFKLTTASVILVLPLSAGFWYYSLLSERRHLTEGAVDFVATFAELVRNTVREEMLRNDREALGRTIASISGAQPLRALRIYDSRGRVAFSSDAREVGTRVVADQQPCVGCHADPLRPLETLHTTGRHTFFDGPDGGRVLSYVEPIYNEPVCTSGSCHAHPPGQRVLGVMIAEFPLTRVDARLRRQVRSFAFFGVLYLVALASAGSFIFWRIVLRPVGALAGGVEQVTAGDLTHTVRVISEDEIGRLAASFNAMTTELAASRRRTEELTEGLEREVEAKSAEVRRTEARLAEAEKLAALGRLTAEIAHEIRNPLTAVGGYGRRLLRTISDERSKGYAQIVVDEVTRLEALLRDILNLSGPARFALERRALTPVVRDSLAAFGERCERQGVAVVARLDADEQVFIDAAQVRRAVDNLVANAIDAMPDGGTLRVSTQLARGRCLPFVVVRVEDTGPGIAESDRERVYEPFWTTKRGGSGTGLGLPISRRIVEAHGGFIVMENRPEGGLCASLWFPYQSDEALAQPPCWEAVHCGRAGEDVPDPCPAWPHFGRACWAIAGTLCEGSVQGTQALILGDCTACGFFRQMSHRDGGS